jgi:hypothetical protein
MGSFHRAKKRRPRGYPPRIVEAEISEATKGRSAALDAIRRFFERDGKGGGKHGNREDDNDGKS